MAVRPPSRSLHKSRDPQVAHGTNPAPRARLAVTHPRHDRGLLPERPDRTLKRLTDSPHSPPPLVAQGIFPSWRPYTYSPTCDREANDLLGAPQCETDRKTGLGGNDLKRFQVLLKREKEVNRVEDVALLKQVISAPDLDLETRKNILALLVSVCSHTDQKIARAAETALTELKGSATGELGEIVTQSLSVCDAAQRERLPLFAKPSSFFEHLRQWYDEGKRGENGSSPQELLEFDLENMDFLFVTAHPSAPRPAGLSEHLKYPPDTEINGGDRLKAVELLAHYGLSSPLGEVRNSAARHLLSLKEGKLGKISEKAATILTSSCITDQASTCWWCPSRPDAGSD